MQNPKEIKIEEYNYNLPNERIAKYPLPQRDLSKLLVYNQGQISHTEFSSLPSYLETGTLLACNNTKVIQARLVFYKSTGARIEIFCLEPSTPTDFALSFAQTGECTWKCIIGNRKKWKESTISLNFNSNGKEYTLTAEKVQESQSSILIKFSWNHEKLSFGELLDLLGQTPIPPYLARKAEESDKKNYQTVYSRIKGSVAAPTAGLHFTDQVFSELQKKGIAQAELTLHVGAGTFKPVQSDTIGEHEMHTEHFFFTRENIESLLKYSGNIIAIGTTTVRTLESIYRIGVKLLQGNTDFHISQWEAYVDQSTTTCEDSLHKILDHMVACNIDHISGSTDIMIVPGYKFQIIKGLVTNFHQPQSTLLLLISALIGEDWKKIYEYAMDNDFRFLSYGDSSLLLT